MMYKFYIDGELYCATSCYAKAVKELATLEHMGYVLINAMEMEHNEFMWEFRLA